MTRVFLIDDHPLMREAVRQRLEQEPDLAVCGTAATAALALEHVADAGPDVVLVDVSLPDMSGIDLARLLRTHHPHLTMAMFSGHGEASHVTQALDAGANGYVLKGNSDELPDAIRTLARGDRYLSAPLHDRL